MKNKHSGFTLIEVLIVVTIVAILAAIAIPSYQQYVLKGRRADAKEALGALQLAQEKYRGNNTAYSVVLADIGISATSSQGYYTLAITPATGTCPVETCYAATATVNAASAQAPDATKCPALLVTI